MGAAKPPNTGGYFPIPNWVFDHVMPRLSMGAFKVFCACVRQTWGFRRPGGNGNRDRRVWDRISYSQFRKMTGIKSDTTISRAIDECIRAGFLLRRPDGSAMDYGTTLFAYRVSLDYASIVNGQASPDSVGVPSTESVVPPSTDSGDTKRHRKHDDDVYIEDHHEGHAPDDRIEQAADALIERGWNAGKADARAFSEKHGTDRVLDICRHAKGNNIGGGWIRKNINTWEPTRSGGGASAEERDRAERHRKYTGEGTEYAQFIDH